MLTKKIFIKWIYKTLIKNKNLISQKNWNREQFLKIKCLWNKNILNMKMKFHYNGEKWMISIILFQIKELHRIQKL